MIFARTLTVSILALGVLCGVAAAQPPAGNPGLDSLIASFGVEPADTASGPSGPSGSGAAPSADLFPTQPPFAGWTLSTDQDLFADWYDNQDRNYTMGVGIQVQGSFIPRLPNAKLHHWLDRKLGLGPPPLSSSYHSLMLAGSGFTPDSLRAEDPVIGDRPYGSLLTLHSVRINVRGEERETAVTTELAIGGLGLGVARQVQTFIHERNSSDVPQGWGNQISDGGEPTLAYRASADRRLLQARASGTHQWLDFSGGVGVWAGYYTNAFTGARVRLGYFHSEFWQFGAAPLSGVNQATRSSGGEAGGELFAFAGAYGRIVLYNALLQGQLRHSVYTLESSQLNPLVGEFSFGLHASRRCGGWTYHLTWVSLAGRTAEFRTDFSRNHFWGALYAGMTRPLWFGD